MLSVETSNLKFGLPHIASQQKIVLHLRGFFWSIDVESWQINVVLGALLIAVYAIPGTFYGLSAGVYGKLVFKANNV
jgi:hypothetical protein